MARDDIKKTKFGFSGASPIIDAVANIPFGNKVGGIIPQTKWSNWNFTSLLSPSGIFSGNRVPGVFTSFIEMFIGDSANNQALNAILTKLYTDLVRRISGAKSVERTDYGMYIFCSGSIANLITQLKVIYNLAVKYKTYNLYYCRSLLTSLVDVDDLIANLADFRGFVNATIARVNSLNIPNIPLIKSGEEYLTTLLLDNPDPEHAQTYTFQQRVFLKWDSTSNPNGTQCTRSTIFGGGVKFANLVTAVNNLLQPIFIDDDAVDMSAWVGLLYEDKCIKFDYLSENDEIIKLCYDMEALSVVENADVMPYTGYSIGDIEQSSGVIGQLTNGTYGSGNNNDHIIVAYDHGKYLNFHKTKVSPADVARAVSLGHTIHVGYQTSKSGIWSIGRCAPYIITFAEAVMTPEIPGISLYKAWRFKPIYIGDGMQELIAGTMALQAFDHHPYCQYIECTWSAANGYTVQSSGNDSEFVPLIDWDNYTILDETTLGNIFDAMWYTYLDVIKD